MQTDVTSENSFTLPTYYGIGWSLRLNDKLLVTSDYKQSKWSKSKPLETNIKFVNSKSYIVGAEYIPSNSFRDQGWKRIHYRVGGYINDSYMLIGGQQIQDKGLTFGIGLPILKSKMFINIAYQIGQKGAGSNQNIITENYQNLNINITLFDFWFAKPKFD